jgi:hypothetical protein
VGCGLHCICEKVLKVDMLIHRHCEQQALMDKKTGKYIESAMFIVYWVTEGIDCCHVGFLPQHNEACRTQYNGVLCQVTEVGINNSAFLSIREKYKKNSSFIHATIVRKTSLACEVIVIDAQRKNLFDNLEYNECKVVGVKKGISGNDNW